MLSSSNSVIFPQITSYVGASLCICCVRTCVLFFCAHLIRLGAGQAARQWSTVGGKSGGERGAAVCQNGLKVTGQLLRIVT